MDGHRESARAHISRVLDRPQSTVPIEHRAQAYRESCRTKSPSELSGLIASEQDRWLRQLMIEIAKQLHPALAEEYYITQPILDIRREFQ